MTTFISNASKALLTLALLLTGCAVNNPKMNLTLNHETTVDVRLQEQFEGIDSEIRNQLGISQELVNAGLLDLKTGRLAMIHPDRIEYAASIAKVGILLAYFQLHPSAATNLDAQTKHELGLMAKASSNEMATKFSEEMGLRKIQEVLDSHGFYDRANGGGIWMGKHYGKSGERIPDPVGNNSHAATVRQLLRFFLLLDQRRLVSPDASARMLEIFASPEIPHDQIKFVKGLAGRDVTILRKWGSWEDYLHDSAIIEGPGRKYVLVAMTHHPRGDEYLEALAGRLDDLMQANRK